MEGHFSGETKAPAATCPEAQGFQKYGAAIFLRKKKAPAATYPQVGGLQKYGGHFSGKKKRLRQRAQKLRACKNMGVIFLKKKKAPAAK